MESLVSKPFDTHLGGKKSPFMPFKDRTAVTSDTNYAPSSSSPHTSPLSSTSRYFDRYPKRPLSSPAPQSRSRGRDNTRSVSPSMSERDSDTDSIGLGVQGGSKSSTGRSPQFPTFDSTDDSTTDFASGERTPKPHTRTRSRSGPPKKSGWKPPPHVPPLRYSGTSTVETPPQTPIESPYRPSLDRTYPVVVGVEAMDALVDGMNGLDSDSYFGESSGRSKTYRSRFAKIPNHHPLYQPPLPKPPPGVILGGGRHGEPISSSGDDDEDSPRKVAPPRHSRRWGRSSSSPPTSKSAITISPPNPSLPQNNNASLNPDTSDMSPQRLSFQSEDRKSLAPSISDIIRTHAPPAAQVRSKPTIVRTLSQNRGYQATVKEETESEPEPEPLTPDEQAEFFTRSSIDSIANEVQQTLRNQRISKLAADLPSLSRASPIRDFLSDGPASPRSATRPVSSIYSSAVSTHAPPSTFEPSFSASQMSPSQSIAQYLRSTRLTTLLKLTRYPHATPQQPLTVSLSDLGSPTGFPVVMFLGLGCVRHVMGLYDEMAEILGLRLITIDRWGLGRTDTPRPKSARGIMEWASVVEEVLDMLNIEQCSVMAHSAGAPYALSFANRAPDRIRGDICLLAPWVGGSESGGYKWLKYVPNGILKTAQAAEWKVQTWMIGKPPTIAYQGIGYNAITQTSPRSRKGTPGRRSTPSRSNSGDRNAIYPESQPRPSIDSNVSSEYDDLRDFDGRFESRSTLGAKPPSLHSRMSNGNEPKRRPSRGFLRRLKSTGSKSNSQPQSPTYRPPSPMSGSSRKLKALRSMGSLKGKSSSAPNTVIQRAAISSPQLPKPLVLEVGLGLGDIDWAKSLDTPSTPPAMQSRPISSDTVTSSNTSDTFEWARTVVINMPSTPPPAPSKPITSEIASVSDKSSNSYAPPISRAGGRRSMSFSVTRSSPSTVPTSPAASTYTSIYASSITGGSYQASLGNALIAASHAESAKGVHNDFLQILNHDNRPWGFQYSTYPHKVRVWYGDKDEKIAENAVRWMERNMGEERCQVKVVKGADHALMYKSAVVIEVLERIREHARADTCTSWINPSV